MNKSAFKTVGCLGLLMLAACAQTQPAPVVGGYQKSNMVNGVSAGNSGFSMTREVSAKAGDGTAETVVGQAAPAAATAPASIKEEDLQSISPAAGPASKAIPAPAKASMTGAAATDATASATPVGSRSLLADWTEKPVAVQGVESHKVEPGETVYRLARRYNTTPAEIIKLNQMDSTADLRTGQVLKIPAGSKSAGAQVALSSSASGSPVSVARANLAQNDAAVVQKDAAVSAPRLLTSPAEGPASKAVAAALSGKSTEPEAVAAAAVGTKPDPAAQRTEAKLESVEPAAGPKEKAKEPVKDSGKGEKAASGQPEVKMHTVAKGETVYRIAHQYGANVLDVMTANQFTQPQDLKAGMVVRVPVKSADAKIDGTKAVSREEDETLEAKPVPTKTAVDEVKAAFNKGKIDPVAARAKGLAWPVHGEVIRRFGSEGGGVSHAGINIAVPMNTPVLATDGGTVLYAGSGLKTYGYLVLVRHESGLVSAYAHNNQLLVSKGETVKKGQVIALSGATGNVDKPQLHFELRRDAGAVDPMTMLAAQ